MAASAGNFSVSASAADSLISSHDGTMALLFLYLCRHEVYEPEQAAMALCLTMRELDSAYEKLSRLGLTGEEHSRVSVSVPVIPSVPAVSADGKIPQDDGLIPEYSMTDILSRTAGSDEFITIQTEAAKVIGHALSTPDLKKLFGIYDYLELPAEVVMMLLNYCTEISLTSSGQKRAPTMRFIEKQAYIWHRLKIDSFDAAEAYISECRARSELTAKIQSVLGVDAKVNTPSVREKIDQWISWGYKEDVVAEAFDRTVYNTGKFAVGYMNSIISNWYNAGFKTLEDILSSEPPRKKSPGKNKPAEKPKAAGTINDSLPGLEDILKKI